MAYKEIPDLTAATTSLDGTETVHVVQDGNSRKVTVDNLRLPILDEDDMATDSATRAFPVKMESP